MFFGAPGAEALPRLPSWPHWNGTGAFPAVCLLALVSLRPSVQFFSLQPRLLFLGRSAFALHESLLTWPHLLHQSAFLAISYHYHWLHLLVGRAQLEVVRCGRGSWQLRQQPLPRFALQSNLVSTFPTKAHH